MKKILLVILLPILLSCSEDNVSPGAATEGIGGSLARFTIKNNYLYVVNENDLFSFDISTPETPVTSNFVTIGGGIETIYPFHDYLLIGSSEAFYIYSTLKDPSRPEYVSHFEHWEACDPVVAQGDFAYVTLRSGSSCSPWSPNQLDVVNISNPKYPTQASSLQLQNPHGLAISGNTLLVCEGTFGLTMIDVTDPYNPQKITTYSNFHAYDVIIRDNLVIVTGNDGYFQFILSESGLEKISEIKFL